jgi:hypothetical protein
MPTIPGNATQRNSLRQYDVEALLCTSLPVSQRPEGRLTRDPHDTPSDVARVQCQQQTFLHELRFAISSAISSIIARFLSASVVPRFTKARSQLAAESDLVISI